MAKRKRRTKRAKRKTGRVTVSSFMRKGKRVSGFTRKRATKRRKTTRRKTKRKTRRKKR